MPHIRADLAVPCERDRSHTIRMGTATLNLMLAAGTLVSDAYTNNPILRDLGRHFLHLPWIADFRNEIQSLEKWRFAGPFPISLLQTISVFRNNSTCEGRPKPIPDQSERIEAHVV